MYVTPADVVAWAEIHPSIAATKSAIIQDVVNAEFAEQSAICVFPLNESAYPPALRMAMLRRCARALAMAEIPLGILTGLGEGGGLSRPAKLDIEVQRYEARYRILVTG